MRISVSDTILCSMMTVRFSIEHYFHDDLNDLQGCWRDCWFRLAADLIFATVFVI